MQHCSVFPLSYNDGATGNGALNTVTLGTGDQAFFTYDPLNRLTEKLIKTSDGTPLFKHAIAYKNRENNQTTNLVQFYNVRRADGSLIAGNRYSYDSMGNITAIKQSTGSYFPLVSYDYDDQGQLISEKFYDGNGNGESHITDSYTYTYDTAGNILSVKKNGAIIKSYTYSTGDWKDLLTAVDGSPIVYEGQSYSGGTVSGTAISGNPIRYTNGTQTYTNLTWQHGRQLVSLTTGGKTSTFEYDHEGIRTEKIYNSVYHDYVTQNGKVVRETVQSADWDWVLDFIYDNGGRPFALKYSYDGGNNFETYYYILNYQGDVVALMDTSGAIVAHYTYNAWGEILTATGDMAETNPLRYRGYYYDPETGFYYLQSRYYDPMNHRFINADSIVSTGQGFTGTNMFAYCNNCPVIYSDHSGHISKYSSVALFEGGGGEIPHGDNIDNMLAFFGVNDVSDLPELEEGCMVFIENIYTITVFGVPMVVGKTIVMDKDKYCQYRFWGVSKGISPIASPVDYCITKGYVYGVTAPSDYEGLFFGGSLNLIADGAGGAVAFNSVTAEILDVYGIIPSAGFSVTYYMSSGDGWTYGKANIEWKTNNYQYLFPANRQGELCI